MSSRIWFILLGNSRKTDSKCFYRESWQNTWMCQEVCLFTAFSLCFCVSACGMEKHHPHPQSLLEHGNRSGLRKQESLFLKPVAIPSKCASCPRWSLPPEQDAFREVLQQQQQQGGFGGPPSTGWGWPQFPGTAALGPPACCHPFGFMST